MEKTMNISMNPIILTIGSLELRWYGVMVALAILTVVLWTYYQTKKGAKITSDQVLSGFIIGTISGIIGARLLHVVDYWSYYSAHPENIIGGDGLAIYGGILGAALGLLIYSKFSKFKALYLFDVMAPGIAFSQAVGRIGCLINGCCYGAHCDLPWAISYSHPDSFAEKLNFGYHPTQVYEMIFMVILGLGLILLKKKIRFMGSQFYMYFGCYSVFRFAVGFIRDNEAVVGNLVQSQVIGLVASIICFGLIGYNYYKYKKNGSVDPELEAIEADAPVEEVKEESEE